jgi:hypothetical protein
VCSPESKRGFFPQSDDMARAIHRSITEVLARRPQGSAIRERATSLSIQAEKKRVALHH